MSKVLNIKFKGPNGQGVIPVAVFNSDDIRLSSKDIDNLFVDQLSNATDVKDVDEYDVISYSIIEVPLVSNEHNNVNQEDTVDVPTNVALF